MGALDTALDLWHLHRRAVALGAALVTALVAVLLGLAVVVRATGQPQSPAARPAVSPTSTVRAATPGGAPASESTAAAASDVADWNAMPPVTGATSSAYPAIGAAGRADPGAYARAFATELFTRDYRTDRALLLSWAQYEDAPLRSSNYPAADWSKVLLDSLSDITWDNATDTPIPADGPWLALRAQQAIDTVSAVKVSVDQQWEQQVAAGYQPADPSATVRDVTLTVTRHATVFGRRVTQRFAISLDLQLGASPHGGYGIAATNNYVTTAGS